MIRDLFLIASFVLVGACWYMIPYGRIRNASILLTSSIAIFLLLSRGDGSNSATPTPDGSSGRTKGDVPDESLNRVEDLTPEQLVPSRSLGECLRYHKINEHPQAIHLLNRIQDYRTIVIKIAKERGGTGTIWRDSDDDHRVRSCLCGTLTRGELIKGLEIEERDPDPPLVGAGMGIENALRGVTHGPIAEDGKPARRVLYDPIADKYFNTLMAHRPEAKEDLMMARERYVENVLRRLVGPLDGKGNPIVPLCIWKKRFDGHHYKDFEDIESKFMG
jgi:hypothetical protein